MFLGWSGGKVLIVYFGDTLGSTLKPRDTEIIAPTVGSPSVRDASQPSDSQSRAQIERRGGE